MRIPTLILAALLALVPAAGRAEVTVVPDPDKWIEQALKDITEGRTDEFSRSFLTMIDKPEMYDNFSKQMATLARIRPSFVEKVSDVKYGTAIREVIYLALYERTQYAYFRFTVKKNVGGWLISNFDFKGEPAQAFPKGFLQPQ